MYAIRALKSLFGDAAVVRLPSDVEYMTSGDLPVRIEDEDPNDVERVVEPPPADDAYAVAWPQNLPTKSTRVTLASSDRFLNISIDASGVVQGSGLPSDIRIDPACTVGLRPVGYTLSGVKLSVTGPLRFKNAHGNDATQDVASIVSGGKSGPVVAVYGSLEEAESGPRDFIIPK